MSDDPVSHRPVRSFVRREGRLTPAQARALAELWPRYGIEFAREPLDLDAAFGRAAPRTLEIGFGNGETLAELARRHPERDHLGVEVHRPGIGRLLRTLGEEGIDNVRVVSHDAVEVLEAQIPRSSLDEVLVYFPDPWPKKRHHKRRLIQPAFLTLVARALRPGGLLCLATDWESYAEHMLEVLSASEDFENTAGAGFAERPASRPETKFERRGQKLGHGVWDLVFRRR